MLSSSALYTILKRSEFINSEKLVFAKKFAASKKISLWEALVGKDIVTDENLGKIAADYYKLPFVTLGKVSIPLSILQIIPEEVAKNHQVISFDLNDESLKLATSNPEDKELLTLISKKLGLEVNIYFSTERDIADTLHLYKKELQKTFDALLEEQVSEAGKSEKKDAPITKLVDTLIEYAYENKASDIHVEPEEDQTMIRFRIDGILHDVLKLPKELHDQVTSRIKVKAKLRTDEHLSAQDGKMQVKLEEEKLDIRVSIVPIVEGEKVVLRLLASHYRQFGLSDLGMSEADLEKVKEGFNKPFGMILATGPTGSGKTTTIYAILKILNTREKNIATIEDPVEYDIEGINQIQVNPKTNLTFADGLRSILRQDPDIIYVGEIRDNETADIAINSAMTGHLVLSTLHTNDAATSLPRLIDMEIEPFLVASTVNVIIAQRLVRKICEKCKVSGVEKIEDLSKHISVETFKKAFRESAEIRVYHGKGCPVCHLTGYQGRVGIFEILKISESIQDLITQKADADSITRKGVEEGMTTMMDDGLRKVQLGITTIEEVLRATKES